FMAIVLVSASHLSASVTFLDDFEGNIPNLTKWSFQDRTYNPYDSGNSRPGQEIYIHTTFSRGEDFVNEVRMISRSPISSDLAPPTFGYFSKASPDELLTQGINFRTSIPDWLSVWDSDIQPDSEPADDIVFDNDVDYFKAMRVPTPTSLLLVAIGLLSLRYTRRLRR
ncbi:hypothetical protein ACFL3Q_02640, partial [Planctomycetota bacterium]